MSACDYGVTRINASLPTMTSKAVFVEDSAMFPEALHMKKESSILLDHEIKHEYQPESDSCEYDAIRASLDHEIKIDIDIGPEVIHRPSIPSTALYSKVIKITRLEFFNEWKKHKTEKKIEGLLKYICLKEKLNGIAEHSLKSMKNVIRHKSTVITGKWRCSNRSHKNFLAKNAKWLMLPDILFQIDTLIDESPSNQSTQLEVAFDPDTHKTDDKQLSIENKRRKVADLTETRSISGQVHVPEASRELLNNPTSRQCKRNLTSEEALAYFIDSDSTIHMYKENQKATYLYVGHKIFPSFSCVRKAMNACYPAKEHFVVNETRAEISIQAVLDKTAERLVLGLQEVLNSKSSSSFTLISKWGGNGCSGHTVYAENFMDCKYCNEIDGSEECLLLFSFVPIQLHDNLGYIIWKNPYPTSTMLCRPLKFMKSKDGQDFNVTDEISNISTQLKYILPTACKVVGTELKVEHKMVFIKTDEEICKTEPVHSSSQKCYLCGATSEHMNEESKNEISNIDSLSFGLSISHIWVRCFECLLQISYRLNVKKYGLLQDNDKADEKQRSELIKQRFENELDLIFDQSQLGLRNINNERNAKRFFINPDDSADITGLDKSLIQKFRILLQTLSSGHTINVEKYEVFALETRKLYLSLYPWYHMPVTVHMILLHSAAIMKSGLIPFGELAEQALRARCQECRRFGDSKHQMQSNLTTNRDLINMLLVKSDPVISNLSTISKTKLRKLSSEVLDLVILPAKNKKQCPVSSTNSTVTDDHQYSSCDSCDDDTDDGYF